MGRIASPTVGSAAAACQFSTTVCALNASPLWNLMPCRRGIVHAVYDALGVAESASMGSQESPLMPMTKSGSKTAFATQNPDASILP